MISGMRKDILVAGFLLSIIDRYKGNILVVCPNSCKRKIASTLTFLGGCFAATNI